MKLLLAAGAKVNSLDRFGESPLFSAIWGNREEVVRLLLEHGAAVNFTNLVTQGTPLTTAAIVGNRAVVAMLLTRGAHLEARLQGAATPLALAATQGRAAVVDLLLDRGADSRIEVAGRNLLLLALADLPPKLVERNAIQLGGQNGLIRLQPAFPGDQLETVRRLLKAGLNPNASTRDGSRLPLSMTAVLGLPDVAETLLAGGADPFVEESGAFNAFHVAVDRGQVEVLKVLLRHDRKILKLINGSARTDDRTPLHLAALGFFRAETVVAAAPDYGATVAWLVAQGAQLEAISEGMTPLIRAARTGNLPVVDALLNAGAQVNARNRSGETALHWAVTQKDRRLVERLLASRADPGAQDIFGITPLSIAVGAGDAWLSARLRLSGNKP